MKSKVRKKQGPIRCERLPMGDITPIENQTLIGSENPVIRTKSSVIRDNIGKHSSTGIVPRRKFSFAPMLSGPDRLVDWPEQLQPIGPELHSSLQKALAALYDTEGRFIKPSAELKAQIGRVVLKNALPFMREGLNASQAIAEAGEGGIASEYGRAMLRDATGHFNIPAWEDNTPHAQQVATVRAIAGRGVRSVKHPFQTKSTLRHEVKQLREDLTRCHAVLRHLGVMQ